MASKLTGMCMQCRKPYKTLVSWCPKCIEKETKKYEKQGYKRVKK